MTSSPAWPTGAGRSSSVRISASTPGSGTPTDSAPDAGSVGIVAAADALTKPSRESLDDSRWDRCPAGVQSLKTRKVLVRCGRNVHQGDVSSDRADDETGLMLQQSLKHNKRFEPVREDDGTARDEGCTQVEVEPGNVE